MKDNDVKKAIDSINIDDTRKTRILNKIQIKSKNQERGIAMKINNKILGSLATIVLVIGGIFVFNCNNINKSEINEITLGTSPVKTEKLGAIGIIDAINSSGENNEITLKVVDDKKNSNINVNINVGTNIFKKDEDELLDIKDLSKGQKIEVYYDATNSDSQISALRIEIIK